MSYQLPHKWCIQSDNLGKHHPVYHNKMTNNISYSKEKWTLVLEEICFQNIGILRMTISPIFVLGWSPPLDVKIYSPHSNVSMYTLLYSIVLPCANFLSIMTNVRYSFQFLLDFSNSCHILVITPSHSPNGIVFNSLIILGLKTDARVDLNTNSRYSNDTWRRHQTVTFSALLALCEGNLPVTGGFPRNGWINNRDAGDLRRHRAHYDIIVMKWIEGIWISGVGIYPPFHNSHSHHNSIPADIWRKNNVIITSKRRCDVVLT